MAWIIDRDILAEEDRKEGREVDPPGSYGNAVGIVGPSSYKGDCSELTKKFRMLDDDGIVMYHGRCDTDNDDNALGPLDDFGTPNAGAVMIQYKVEGKWKSLN